MQETGRKRALITGITGQDGSYLAELLLQKGYEVHGVVRRSSSFNTARIEHLYVDPHSPNARIFLHYGDLVDGTGLREVLSRVQPNEVYNLGAQSHVRVSFDQPVYTVQSDALGTINLLAREGVYPTDPELFVEDPGGKLLYVASYWQTVNYREAYGMFAVNGILFNHESPRRGETFVTRKITRAATRIKEGLQQKLYLGNLDAKRDWGFAGDYVEAMWLMLQHHEANDYVIATGETHSVREFLDEVFGLLKLDWKQYVDVDPRYFRPAEVDLLLGDATKARRDLGWKPRVTFRQLAKMMTETDWAIARRERTLAEHDKKTATVA